MDLILSDSFDSLEDENGSKDEKATVGFTSSSLSSFRMIRSAFTHSGRNCNNEGNNRQQYKGYQRTQYTNNLLFHKRNRSNNVLSQTWLPPFVSSTLIFILIQSSIPQGSTVLSSGTGFSMMSLQSSKLRKTFSNSSLKPYLRYELVDTAKVRSYDYFYVLPILIELLTFSHILHLVRILLLIHYLRSSPGSMGLSIFNT